MQNSDSTPPSGVVELREDVPLKAGGARGGAGACGGCGGCGGPRLIAACFAALSAAVTVALLAQIYSGDYQVVPHGAVSAAARECSGAGSAALKAGGRAADAAAAAALCLALLAPHRTSLDASGCLLYWEYRDRAARAAGPQVWEWGGPGAGPGAGAGGPGAGPRVPRLLAALAQLHAAHGALPWRRVLQPAIDLARDGFPVSRWLAAAAAGAGRAGWPWRANQTSTRTDPDFARYLESLQHNSSAELWEAWSKGEKVVRFPPPQVAPAGGWRLYAGGAGAVSAARGFAAGLAAPRADVDEAERRVLNTLVNEAKTMKWPPGGVATGLAVVDAVDTYIALVTGLSLPFGSLPPWGLDGADAGPGGESGAGGEGSAAAARDAPGAPLDLAPAILLDDTVCGTRYVMGAESSGALAQAAAALAVDAGADADAGAGGVERERAAVVRGGALLAEPGAALAAEQGAAPSQPGAPVLRAAPPFAAVNVVQQRGDALASHADSRAGGYGSRF